MNIDRIVSWYLAAAFAVAACAPSSEETPSTRTWIASASAGGYEVALLTDRARLETGMTAVYLEIATASGAPVTDAEVTFAPLMTMTGGASHGAPVLGAPALGGDGVYHVDVVFQMASGAMGSWSAAVGVTRPGAETVEVAFPSLAVADSGAARTFSHFDPETDSTTKYVASLNFVARPKVGLNPVVLTLHRMQGGTTFVPIVEAAMVLEPWMTSMGHGSPGSVNPTPTTLGRYEGELSFSMPGTWETTVTISQGGVTLGAPRFTTTF